MTTKKYEGTKREKKLQASATWVAKYPERALLRSTRARAKFRDIEWDIPEDYFYGLLSTMRCEVSGLPLSFNGGKHDPWRPSVDRKDPTKGYTRDNVQIVCWIYNRAKHIGLDADVLRLAQALVREGPDNR